MIVADVCFILKNIEKSERWLAHLLVGYVSCALGVGDSD
jgi:hypothetical protein